MTLFLRRQAKQAPHLNSHQTMDEPLDSIAKILLGALLGALINHGFAVKRERRRDREAREHAASTAKEQRKRDFCLAIASLRDVILAVQDTELVEAHKQSLPRFREECAKVEPDVTDAFGYKATRDEYLGITPPDIECPDRSQEPPPPRDQFGNYKPQPGWQPPCRYNLGRQRLKTLLDTMINHKGVS